MDFKVNYYQGGQSSALARKTWEISVGDGPEPESSPLPLGVVPKANIIDNEREQELFMTSIGDLVLIFHFKNFYELPFLVNGIYERIKDTEAKLFMAKYPFYVQDSLIFLDEHVYKQSRFQEVGEPTGEPIGQSERTRIWKIVEKFKEFNQLHLVLGTNHNIIFDLEGKENDKVIRCGYSKESGWYIPISSGIFTLPANIIIQGNVVDDQVDRLIFKQHASNGDIVLEFNGMWDVSQVPIWAGLLYRSVKNLGIEMFLSNWKNLRQAVHLDDRIYYSFNLDKFRVGGTAPIETAGEISRKLNYPDCLHLLLKQGQGLEINISG